MPSYDYLIIGGGMTADAAVKGIRSVDENGSIGLLSKESHPPYARPPLTKNLWKDGDLEDIWRHTADKGVTLHLGREAQLLDGDRKQVSDDRTDVYTFDKLLLAMGGTPRRLPVEDDRGVMYFRTLEDYRRLAGLADGQRRFGVIGGGFIGWEVAAALAMNQQQVSMIFMEDGIGGLRFPPDLAEFLNSYYRDHGVQVLPGRPVANVSQRGDQVILHTDDHQVFSADVVVAGLGIEPNTALAQTAGLVVDNGIVVDEFLRTSKPEIYAAGDVASFYDPILDTRRRVEHEDAALTMGESAGRAMAGDPQPYNHSPYFYSDLFDLGFEAVGELDPSLQIASDWEEPYRKGVVYYLDQGRVRGVLLWNVWGQVEAARELIAAETEFKPEELKGRLPT